MYTMERNLIASFEHIEALNDDANPLRESSPQRPESASQLPEPPQHYSVGTGDQR